MKKLAFIFPGQGSQSVGMGKDFYYSSKIAKELLDSSSNSLNLDFKNLLFTENEKLSISEFTQPAIVLNSLMAYEAFNEKVHINPVFSLGHSLGEFSALCVSKAAKIDDILKTVSLRGKFMQEDCNGKDAGMMVVLGLDDDTINDICFKAKKDNKSIFAANFNCNGQVVIAGSKQDLKDHEIIFKEAGAKRAMLLEMSVASHCPILQNASIKLVAELESLLNNSFLPVISNVTAKSYSTKEDALVLLKEQLVSPVLYKQSILNIENDVDCFIEFGSSVLKGINKKITKKPTYSIFDIKSLDETVSALEEK